MRNAGQFTCVVLFLLIQVHCKEDAVNTLLKLLDRVDNKPMVKHVHSGAANPVNSLFQLFDRTDKKPMVVVMEKGKEPRTLDFVVDDGTGSDSSIRDMFGFNSASDDEDESLEEEDKERVEALAQSLLSGSDSDQVKQEINVLRQNLIARCGQKKQCGKKQNECNKYSNCKKMDEDECSKDDSEEQCGKKTTKCPPKWFSTGRPSWKKDDIYCPN